ncbi:MAG: DMT family transporter [Desulfovibrionaceae bacterium]|nr:DMT family transporter [Desulfovibrionaceae bacterium]
MRLFLLTGFCLTLFALNSILCRAALIIFGMEPFQYIAIRSLSAAGMLAGLCALHGIRRRDDTQSGVWRQVWDESSWSGAAFLFLYMLCFTLGYVSIDSATGTLILNLSVQAGMVGWGLARGLRPGGRQTLGLGIAVAGLAALMSPGLTAPSPLHALLMAGSGLAWAGYSICGRRAASASLSTAGNFLRCIPAGLALAGLALVHEQPACPQALLCALAAGALASALGYILWYAVVPRYSLVASSIIQLCVPLITALLAVTLLNETLTLRLVVCSVPILGGILLALVGPKKA